jgi:hypothetical protein
MKIEFSSTIHRYSDVPGLAPSANELLPGELALNVADNRLFTRGSNGMVIDLTYLNSRFNLINTQDGNVLTYNAATGRYTPQPVTINQAQIDGGEF